VLVVSGRRQVSVGELWQKAADGCGGVQSTAGPSAAVAMRPSLRMTVLWGYAARKTGRLQLAASRFRVKGSQTWEG
jgi:hypothetical protein